MSKGDICTQKMLLMTLKMTQVLLNNQNIRNMLYWKEEYTKLC